MKRVRALLAVFLVMAMIVLDLQPLAAYAATDDPGVEITQYTITYHLDGGTNALKNPDVYTVEDSITLKDATKEGYTFGGWYLDEAKTQAITKISNRTGNIDIYARFIPNTYNATFNGNGADECGYKVTLINDKTGEEKCVYLNAGDSFSPHEYWKPEASGYVYAGWTYNSEVLSDTLKINSNIELVPKWIDNPNNYPVLGDDASAVSSRMYYLGDQRKIMTSRFYTSYEYETYSCHYVLQKYLKNGYPVVCSSCSVIEINSGLTKVYADENDNITGSGGLNSREGYDYFRAAPGSLHYVFVEIWGSGVSYASELNNLWIQVTPLKKRQNIGKIEVNNVAKFDEILNAPSAYKSGYIFLGWYDNQGRQMTDTWQYTEDQTFTAKWAPQGYDIVYELNGGTNSPSNPACYTIEDTITLEDPSKPGYTFKGWYSDANFTTKVTSISKKMGNITLYAKWTINSYNLTIDANDGSFAPKVTFVSDGIEIKSCYLYDQDTITAYRPDNKEGYVFAGWYTDNTFTSLFKFNGTIASDITLYAKWINCDGDTISVESVEKIDVEINGQNGKQYAFIPLADGQITVTSESDNLDLFGILYNSKNSVLTSNDDISDTDLDFSYTYNVQAGQLYYLAVKGNTASTAGQAVVHVDWTGDCTITGTTYPNRQFTVVYDTNYNLPQKPVREGYVFLGWFDENDTQITDGTWNFTTDKTLTAKWEEATYHTVTFKDSDGNIISSGTYYLSEDIVPPELPTKASDNTYTYSAKWDDNFTGVCTGDAVYFVVFEPQYIAYTVIFANEDGTELSREIYHWGDTVTPPANPTKDVDAVFVYTFTGWDQTVVDCAGDTTYTATYTAAPLKQVLLTLLPGKVRYRVAERLDLSGMVLQLVYADDTMISLDDVDEKLANADLSTPGKKTVTVTVAGASTEFEIYVHEVENGFVTVDSSLYPASSHNYSNNLNETKTFTYPGAQSLVITFNGSTYVENGYDYIYIYDGTGNQIAKYTGTKAANKTLTIPGDTFKVRLTSDYINVNYGYAFSNIQAEMENMGEIIHQPVIDPETVTCTQDGLTEGSHCEICGDVLVAQEAVAALGHQYQADFTWSEDHHSCTATISCERDCGFSEVIACTVTHADPNQVPTAHTAVAEYEGIEFDDVLTCFAHCRAFTVSGTITSFGAADDEVTLYLMQGDTEIASTTSLDGTYLFELVLPGNYTLVVSKQNHVTRTYSLTVADTAVVQDVKIHLIGDIDGNGKINVGDTGKAYAHVKKTAVITDEYMLLCADVSGDGKINVGDASKIYAHVKKTNSLW